MDRCHTYMQVSSRKNLLMKRVSPNELDNLRKIADYFVLKLANHTPNNIGPVAFLEQIFHVETRFLGVFKVRRRTRVAGQRMEAPLGPKRKHLAQYVKRGDVLFVRWDSKLNTLDLSFEQDGEEYYYQLTEDQWDTFHTKLSNASGDCDVIRYRDLLRCA